MGDLITKKHDLITKKQAVSRINDLLVLELRMTRLPTWNEVYNAIKEIPPVEVVEVMRCKDCKHFKHGNIRQFFCEVFDWSIEESDYCSFGERKTDGRT